MNTRLMMGVLVAMLPVAAINTSRAVRAAEDWSCRVPESLKGPLDAGLRGDGSVDELSVRVCPGRGGQVGVIWARSPYEDYKKGEMIVAGVLTPDRILATHLVPDIGPESKAHVRVECPLAFSGDAWLAALFKAPDEGVRPTPSNMGIACVRFDSAKCVPPRLVLPEIFPLGDLHVFGDKLGADVFWEELHVTGSAALFLINRHTSFRFQHARVTAEKLQSVCTVHEESRWSSGNENEHRVIRHASGRYDLLFERSGRETENYDLVHIPDLLKAPPSKPDVICRFRIGSGWVAIPLQGDCIQLVWLEQAAHLSTVFHLREARYDGKSWSKPRMLYQIPALTTSSLAATRLVTDGRERILAVWRGSDSGRLTYTLGAGDTWSDPRETSLTIGERNWLVNADGRFVLVTYDKNNLFWCSPTVTQGGAAGSSAPAR